MKNNTSERISKQTPRKSQRFELKQLAATKKSLFLISFNLLLLKYILFACLALSVNMWEFSTCCYFFLFWNGQNVALKKSEEKRDTKICYTLKHEKTVFFHYIACLHVYLLALRIGWTGKAYYVQTRIRYTLKVDVQSNMLDCCEWINILMCMFL